MIKVKKIVKVEVPVIVDTSIKPLELSIATGSQAINDLVEKLQAKINEIITKVN